MATSALLTLESDMPTQLLYYLLGNTETDTSTIDLSEFMPQTLKWHEQLVLQFSRYSNTIIDHAEA